MIDPEIERLITKWAARPAPESSRRLVAEATKPLIGMIAHTLGRWARDEKIDKNEEDSLSTKFGELLAAVRQACYYVGLEEASLHAPDPTPGDAPIIRLALDFDEWVVVDNCLEAARQCIVRKTAITKQALTRLEDDVTRRIDDVRRAVEATAIRSLPHTRSTGSSRLTLPSCTCFRASWEASTRQSLSG